jgi:hypothetical protein
MKTTVLEINKSNSEYTSEITSTLSFRRFINYIEKRISEEKTIKKGYFEFVLEKLKADPTFLANIDLAAISRFGEQLDLIYGVMLPPVADENEVLWALSTPLAPKIFFGTSALYNLITDKLTGELNCDMIKEEENQINVKQKLESLYSLILKRLYNFDLPVKSEMIFSFTDDITRLPKYYKGLVDMRFIEIVPVGPLPELNFESYKLKDNIDWDELAKVLPLSMVRFEGFAIISLTDITADYSVERIKNVILNHSKDDPGSYFKNISESLKILLSNNDIDFGLLPVLRINSKVVFSHESYTYSMVMKNAMEKGMDEDEFQRMAEAYFQDPKRFLLNDIDLLTPQDHFTELLVMNEIKSYALIPIFHNGHIAGILEVFSKQVNPITEELLSKLDVSLPFLAQILQNNIDDFHNRVDSIIKDKFTSIQPSVQWKFKEAAWHHLRDSTSKGQNVEIETIHFKNVYPLYGAIDIRNSTVERNKALRDDLIVHFDALIQTIRAIKAKVSLGLLDELIYKCEKWVIRIGDRPTDHEEMKVKDFFELEVDPLLQHFRESYPEVSYALSQYDDFVNEDTGAAYANRRALESSMQQINLGLNTYIDLFKNQVQESYPSYFEKFRTDGVEYDIYIGQSIAPQKVFSNLYLKNIRLDQLSSMAAIAKITHALLPTMEKPLETTQLIFINHGSIDISFRDDERRFDVEGAYNIRYHVIKKRIDKVHIAGTYERLTQPGKIAMVYFNTKEADEYVEYIRYLQEQGLLNDDLERLELEELQGVTGLKALRVGINLEGSWNQTSELSLAENRTA